MDRTHTELQLHQIDGVILPLVRHFDHEGNEQVTCLRDCPVADLTLEADAGHETVLAARIRRAA